ncbi:MAG: type II toxin-antitoxin system prevent-host-death family antitoxin [Peptococcaceae bacterium]|nr:type II toxin-antitoxin system prevent-host-death family antitoxin [Peptococcaceae bacterium]
MENISVGIREAKKNLSKLLKNVQQGAEIILTDRGKPVGKIVPVSQEMLSLEARLKNLEKNGWIAPPKKKVRNIPPPIPIEDQLAQKILQEDRNA